MSHPATTNLTPSAGQKLSEPLDHIPRITSSKIFHFLDTTAGIFISLILSCTFAYYVYSLHENELWFSNIRDVEREISFRTESGLYYSYYKQFFASPNSSVEEVITELMHDKKTEYPRQINILKRFNIFQEVILALLYRLLTYSNLISLPSPILFYTYSCFFFSGLLHFSLFSLSSKLGHHWSYGLLTSVFLHTHLEDVTRTFFTVNLRENFALPFFFLQNFFLVHILSTKEPAKKSMFNKFRQFSSLQSLAASTFFFSLFWQINQYLLALQSCVLLTVMLFYRTNHIVGIIIAQSIGHALLLPIQFFQPLLLVSLNLVLNASILLSLWLMPMPKTFSLRNAVFRLLFVVSFTIFAQFCLKLLFKVESDTHIVHFLLAKFSILTADVPFESALYICHGAFALLDLPEMVVRSQKSGALLLYALVLAVVIGLVVRKVFKKEQFCKPSRFLKPPLMYMTAQSLLCGLFALLTMRLKYLWFPQACVLAAYGSCLVDRVVGRWARVILVCAISTTLLWRQYGEFSKQMQNEKEFFDPDTVDLMEWIQNLDRNPVFAGSMQLMAGVKACTDRPIANHPHFEDKWLRQRTERLYQIYGKRPVEDVYSILKAESVNHIIVEDSICQARSNGCSTNDLVDLANRHQDDSNSTRFSRKQMSKSKETRFCNRVREFGRNSERFFKLVFENKTFRVYRLVDTA